MKRKHKRVRNKIAAGLALGVALDYAIQTYVFETPPVVTTALLALSVVPMFLRPKLRRGKRRPGYLYEFTVRHPRTEKEVCGYVGLTHRDPQTRYEEHMGNGRYGAPAKPWVDTVTDWRVTYSSKSISEASLARREKVQILLKLPLYNITHNSNNPRRVTPTEAKRQRMVRDRKRYSEGARR